MSAISEETLSVSGVLLAKVFGNQARDIARYQRENQRLAGLEVRQQMIGQGFYAVVLALFDRVFEYLDVVPDIVDAPDAVDLPVAEAGGRVALEDVYFRYPGATVGALSGVSLGASPGHLVALVGPSESRQDHHQLPDPASVRRHGRGGRG